MELRSETAKNTLHCDAYGLLATGIVRFALSVLLAQNAREFRISNFDFHLHRSGAQGNRMFVSRFRGALIVQGRALSLCNRLAENDFR